MKIDRNSYGTVILAWLLAVGASVVAFVLLHNELAVCISAVALSVAIWQTIFHAVPNRTPVGSSTVVTSPADGKVISIGKVVENEFLGRECIQVSVYMDFWDLHANFWPVTGEVTYAKYHPGKHFLAFLPKASDDNEHSCTCIRTPEGNDVFFKQIAGGFARRIVCYASVGLRVEAGRQCGIIKFGSRVDIFLPLDSKILVSVNENIRACETRIAELN